MRYLLVVLSHGKSETLERTLESFRRYVEPWPERGYLHLDLVGRGQYGVPETETLLRRAHWLEWQMDVAPRPLGFCRSVARAWDAATAASLPYVFWLENDFVFDRRVDLRELAYVLDSEPRLAQVALCRGAANADERAAGGLVASRPEAYERASLFGTARPWLRHRAYFTTNPSLMRRDFMAAERFPGDGDAFCEGRFGLGLVERGYSFGLWGGGEPWVSHVGARSGFGY